LRSAASPSSFGREHALVELIDAAGRIDELLLPGEQRVARRTDSTLDILERSSRS
jgi:hypothetical protein